MKEPDSTIVKSTIFSRTTMPTRLLKTKRVLLLNDTYNDYHHGCTGTSYVVRRKLKKAFFSLETISIKRVTRELNIVPRTFRDFTNQKFYKQWIRQNIDIVNTIKKNDWVVVNGEGCISRYNDGTLNLLYTSYIAKRFLGKKVSIINHSVYFNNYVDKLSNAEHNDFRKILHEVYKTIDYSAVREFFSLMQVNQIIPGKGILSFDSLPIYIDQYLPPKKLKREFILISGGNYLDHHKFAKFVNDTIKSLPIKLQKHKLAFLYSANVDYPSNDDKELIEVLKKAVPDIEIINAKSLNDWLYTIKKARFLISGRFHHTIAAFMLDTPFLVFKTNTKKVEAIVSMFEKEYCLLDGFDSSHVGTAVKVISSNKFYEVNCEYLKSQIISLAENNYKFLYHADSIESLSKEVDQLHQKYCKIKTVHQRLKTENATLKEEFNKLNDSKFYVPYKMWHHLKSKVEKNTKKQ